MFLTALSIALLLDSHARDSKAIEQVTAKLFDQWKSGHLGDTAGLFAGEDVPVVAIQRLGKASRVQVSLNKWLSDTTSTKPENVRITVGEVNGSLAVVTVKFKVVTAHQASAVITFSNAAVDGWKIVSLVLHYDRIW